MPAREINPFTALTRIRSQFLRTQWSTSNHSEWTRLRVRPLSHRGWRHLFMWIGAKIWPDITSYRLDEWLWAMFEPTPTWYNFIIWARRVIINGMKSLLWPWERDQLTAHLHHPAKHSYHYPGSIVWFEVISWVWSGTHQWHKCWTFCDLRKKVNLRS